MSNGVQGNDIPLYNSRIFRNYIQFVSKRYKHVDLDDILKYAGMESFQVEDEGHWFTQKQANLFHEQLSNLTHEDISWEAGNFTSSPDSLGILRQYTLSLMGLSAVYENMGKWSKKFSRSSIYESKKLAPCKVELSVVPNTGVQEEPFQCKNRLGYIEGVASLFNVKTPTVEHPECLFQGGNACRYIVSWEETLSGRLRKIRNILYLALLVLCFLSPLFFSLQTALTTVFPLSIIIGFAAGWYADIIKSRELENAMREISVSSNQQMEQVSANYDNSLIINEIGQALNKEQNLHDALKEIFLIMQEHLKYDRGMILLASLDKAELNFYSSYGYSINQEEFLKNNVIKLKDSKSESIFSLVFNEKKTRSIGDLSELHEVISPGDFEYVDIMHSKSIIISPLLHENESFGVLIVDNIGRKKHIYQRDINLLLGISSQIGARLHNNLLQERLKQTQKMEAVGNLAGGIAHDFNSILTTILGYSELTLNQLPDSNPLRGNIEAIHSAGEKASQLTRQLLAFSRGQVMEITINNLNDLVTDMAKMLNRLIGDDVILELSLSDSVGNILADASQIERILLNLSVNARDAMPSGGHLIIKTSQTILADERESHLKNLQPGLYALLTVTDTGEGMSENIRERIFVPFFTTKPTNKGTGLGLSTVYGIVEQHKGYINVQSEVGKGSTFNVYFPIADADMKKIVPKKNIQPTKGSETILVVDDDSSIVNLVNDTLEPLGYKIKNASNGKEALNISRTLKEKIDLIITDVVMPGMNGRQLLDSLHREQPGIKAIMMSGYPDDIVYPINNSEKDFTFIRKPFVPIELAKEVKKTLYAEKGTINAENQITKVTD